MTINDAVFGELEYNYGWVRYTAIAFCGKEAKIALMVDGEEDGEFDKEQYESYTSLMKSWEQVQKSLLHPILDYYKQKRHELGYDIEFNKNYPLVETTDQILEMVDLVGIVVPFAGIFEGRGMGLTFDCTWDMENGLGLLLINEKVTEVGYQDVAI